MPYPSLRRLAGTQEVQEMHISLGAVSYQPQMNFLKNIWLFGFHLMWWKRCQHWPQDPRKRRLRSWTCSVLVLQGLMWPEISTNYGQNAPCRYTNMWEEAKQQWDSAKINQKCERLIQAKEAEGRAVWWGCDQHRMSPVWKHERCCSAGDSLGG